jgi:hypothetical protein
LREPTPESSQCTVTTTADKHDSASSHLVDLATAAPANELQLGVDDSLDNDLQATCRERYQIFEWLCCFLRAAPCDMMGASADLLVILTGSARQCAGLHRLPGALLLPSPLVRQAGLLLLLLPSLLLLLLLMHLPLLLVLLPHVTLIHS